VNAVASAFPSRPDAPVRKIVMKMSLGLFPFEFSDYLIPNAMPID